MPRIEQFRWMLSRPENSGWKPAPSSSSDDTRPWTSTSPDVGRVMPARSLSNVDLPAPFSPMMPTVLPCGMSRYTLRRATKSLWSFLPGMTSSSSRWIGLSYMRYALETPRQTMALPALPVAGRVVFVSAVVIEVVLTCEASEQVGEARFLAHEERRSQQEEETADST